MVAELLDHEPRGAGSATDLHLQVTGKVALGNSATSSTASPSSSPSSGSAAVQTSVIRRGPDSPESNHEDSTWFLRQVLQHQQSHNNQQSRESGAGTPLTPATSPVRGVRRGREDSDEEERADDDDDDELKKKEEDDDIEEEKKRAHVESIINTMRTSTPAINGCKKRKLYQPQQHGQQPLARFTSEGEEEEEEADERNDSLSEQEMVRAQASSRSSQQAIQQAVHDPIRSLQERIASLHQTRFAALQQQQMQQQQQQREKQPEQIQPPAPVRRPVRDDAGRTRNPLHQPQFARSAPMPGDLSHVSQAHAAYLDATRRLLMEQQQRPAPSNGRPPQPAPAPQAPVAQQPKEQSVPQELEGLAEMLKSELASSLAQLVDSTLSRYAAQQQQRRNVIVNNSKTNDSESELSKLQRGRVIDRGLRNGDLAALGLTAPFLRTPYGALPHLFPQQPSPNAALNHIVNSIGAGIHPAAAAAAAAFVQQQQQHGNQQGQSSQADDDEPAESGSNEQDEALSLVVSPKKRRTNNNSISAKADAGRDSPAAGHNADTRLSPLEISLMNHSSANSPPPSRTPTPPSSSQQQSQQPRFTPAPSASSQPAGPPPPLLHHPSLFSNYSAYFAAAAAAAAAGAAGSSQRSKSPVNELDLTSPSTSSLLHPALLASHQHHPRHPESLDRHSESSDRTSPYGSVHQSSTLTPMHLRKAKLMFFWCRYPSSSVLKTFFPDVNFNKNNTAQLVKWFSNFR